MRRLTFLCVLLLALTATAAQAADTTPPTVAITAPADGGTVQRGTVTYVTFTATDDSGLAWVDVTVNGQPLCSALFYYAVTQTSCQWAVPKKPGATYTITATAHDGCTGDPANGPGATCAEPWNVTTTSVTVTSRK